VDVKVDFKKNDANGNRHETLLNGVFMFLSIRQMQIYQQLSTLSNNSELKRYTLVAISLIAILSLIDTGREFNVF